MAIIKLHLFKLKNNMYMNIFVEPHQSLLHQPDLILSRYGPKIKSGTSTETTTG